jgi:hypothetical protein
MEMSKALKTTSIRLGNWTLFSHAALTFRLFLPLKDLPGPKVISFLFASCFKFKKPKMYSHVKAPGSSVTIPHCTSQDLPIGSISSPLSLRLG